MPHSSRGGLLVALALALLASDLGLPARAADSEVVSSNIIVTAGSATLANGNGDVSATGACKKDIKSHCKDVSAGEGRLATCLSKRIEDQRQGNAVGRHVSDKCLEELANFKIDRSSHINKDVVLARACKADVAKLCKDQSDESDPGSVLACLRDRKAELSGAACKAEVFRTQAEVAADYRLDYKLYRMCKDDVSNLCDVEDSAEDGSNPEMECLHEKRRDVSWECQGQLFRSDKESYDDIRLSVRLFSKCVGDYHKFCPNIEPGHMRVQECLEDHMDDAGFSAMCREELDNMIAVRIDDFRLDTALRDACEADIQDMCDSTLKTIDADKTGQIRQAALRCLANYKDELKSDACKDEVHRRLKREGRNIRFDQVLAEACAADRQKYCTDVAPGSARVIRCLQDHNNELASKCSAALFDHQVRMAEDIDFHYPMKRACAWEISSFCKDVPHGHARVVRCLEEHLQEDDMSKSCKREVMRDQNKMARDYRLNYRLRTACESDIPRLCDNLCSTQAGAVCGGLVLQCLTEKQENITNQACQDEVFYFELMEVSDFRNDVVLAEACRDDVDAYCKNVEPGEGRVHTCLRFNKDKISEKCRKQEMKLAAVEYKDIRLRPKLNKLCSEEKAVFCKEVQPGRARVVKCLMENMAQPNFGEECSEELQKREEVMKSDYRYDIGVFTNCAANVDQFCAEQKKALRGNATVLKCLAENFKSLADECQVEMSRAVRLALWDYTPSAALTASCDDDVQRTCPQANQKRAKQGAQFTIGVVGRCLSRALVEGQRLAPRCRQLVLVAAPKDARSYFDYPESTSALVQRLADMQASAGLSGVLVNPYASSSASTVTVTGWVALLCIVSLVVVIVGGGFALLRRLTGTDRPHTLHVKSGDL